MLLDDYTQFRKYDLDNMLEKIDTLPNQLEEAWQLGNQSPLPDFTDIKRVLIAGMGGSAIGADLLASYIIDKCPVPVTVHRDYGLPGWAFSAGTLVILSSHSGNTEETLSAFSKASINLCRMMAITTGGKLAEMARQSNVPLWTFPNVSQPRSAVGYSFGLLLSLFARLRLIPEPSKVLEETVAAMHKAQEILKADVPAISNPAKRMAGQLIDRFVTVIGTGIHAPVARRWKGQISEVAKAWGQFEFLPEANHNTLAGSQNPEDLLSKLVILFLRSPSDDPRNRLRIDLTKESFMLNGISTDFIDAEGNNSLAHQWTLLHFGDYMAYYLAMAYKVNPTPVATIEQFKHEMEVKS